jgi:transposase-like protein
VPQRGVDYPGTWAEFVKWFSDDGACVEYLERLRWPEGFVCPRCGGQRGWRRSESRWLCADCRRETSATAGTIFDGTRTPLQQWFAAAWYVCGTKNGASALGLQQLLGLGSYETAWTWLHKLRRAMVDPDRELLHGDVEVDETFVGGVEPGLRGGRARGKKNLVVIGVECEGAGSGRVRLARIGDASSRSLHPFVTANVEPGAVLLTDAWQGYSGIDRMGYVHKPVSVRASIDDASELLPRVHRVASLLKRWLLGTHQGAVRPAHLDYYLDEFTFRYNRRRSRSRGLLFYRLLQQAVRTAPQPMKVIVGGSAGYRSAPGMVDRSG